MSNSFERVHFVDQSKSARRLLWHLLSIGAVTRTDPDIHKGFEKPGVHLFWIRSGTGTLEIPGQVIQLRPGAICWWVDMTKPRTYRPTKGGRLIADGFRFYGSNLEAWWESMGGINEFQLGDQNSFPLLRQCYRKLQGLERSRPAGYEWRVHLLLTEVMGLLLEERGILAVPHVEQPLAVKRVIDVVLADPRRDWRVEELSERVAVSSSGLRALFRKVQHEGIHEFLQRVRLDCARVLLCDRTISVKEVAEKMNFSSEFYFSHFFRKGTGISPRQFRKDATS